MHKSFFRTKLKEQIITNSFGKAHFSGCNGTAPCTLHRRCEEGRLLGTPHHSSTETDCKLIISMYNNDNSIQYILTLCMHVPVCVECMWCECTCMRVYVCVHLHLHSETTDLVSKLVYHFTTAFHTTKCQQQYGFRDKRRKKQTTLTGYTCRWDQCKEDDGFQALAGPPQSGFGRWSGTRPWSVLPAQSRSNDIRDEHFIPAKQNNPLTQQCCFWHLEQSPPRYQALCYSLFLQKQTQDISLLGIFQLSNIVLHPSQSVQCVHACMRVCLCVHASTC